MIAVAAHDVGEYVRYFSRGKGLIERLRGKMVIMGHLSHADEAVRYESLLCIQKLMTHNWCVLFCSLLRQEGKRLVYVPTSSLISATTPVFLP